MGAIKLTDKQGRVINPATEEPYLFAIAEGKIPGHSILSKRGYSPASAATETTLWSPGTQYVFPTGATAVEAVSSSAVDSDALGTGARTVHLLYLDTNYAEKTWTFVMNGVAPVVGPVDFFRSNSLHVESGVKNVGTIDLRLVGGAATIYNQVQIGAVSCFCSVYTVPINKIYYITSTHFSAGYKTTGKTVRMTLHASMSPDGIVSTSGLLFWPHFESMLMDDDVSSVGLEPFAFPEKTDVKVSVVGETLAQCTSRISGWIETE